MNLNTTHCAHEAKIWPLFEGTLEANQGQEMRRHIQQCLVCQKEQKRMGENLRRVEKNIPEIRLTEKTKMRLENGMEHIFEQTFAEEFSGGNELKELIHTLRQLILGFLKVALHYSMVKYYALGMLLAAVLRSLISVHD